MPQKPRRVSILMACVCAVFWPGAFIFGFPGIMRHHWQQAFNAGDCFGMDHFGAIFGLIFTAYGFFAGPLGPWLSGYILDITGGSYTIVFSYLGLTYLAAAGLILLVRPWRECRLPGS
ncbi:MAG: hypothetical protein JRH12_07240 [Deltaproteobacteria bacterium]|jgi:hypothetical protein|nr:hypothetical protein [Deltaproteobacteria bacterium]MBW2483048.1 hypothetical protein [Deltaproteobacteria bacterium]